MAAGHRSVETRNVTRPLRGVRVPIALSLSLVAASAAPHRASSPPQASPQASPQAEDPRAVVGQATRAVQGDSAAPLRARWSARLQRDSADRAAALGLATVARLTYDYDGAERLYRKLFADSLHPDRFAALAHLGLARQLERRGFGVLAPPQFELAREIARASGDATTEGEA